MNSLHDFIFPQLAAPLSFHIILQVLYHSHSSRIQCDRSLLNLIFTGLILSFRLVHFLTC